MAQAKLRCLIQYIKYAYKRKMTLSYLKIQNIYSKLQLIAHMKGYPGRLCKFHKEALAMKFSWVTLEFGDIFQKNLLKHTFN